MIKNAIILVLFFYLGLVWGDEKVGRDKNAIILVLFFYLSLVLSDEKVGRDKKRSIFRRWHHIVCLIPHPA